MRPSSGPTAERPPRRRALADLAAGDPRRGAELSRDRQPVPGRGGGPAVAADRHLLVPELGLLRALIRSARAAPSAPVLSLLEGTVPGRPWDAAGEGRIDVGFVFGVEDWPRVEHEPLWSEPLVAVLPEGHPLAADNAVRPEDLHEEMFLGWGGRARPRAGAGADRGDNRRAPGDVRLPAGRARNPVQPGRPRVRRDVRTGLGARGFCPGVVYRPLSGARGAVAFHAVWRANGHNRELGRSWPACGRWPRVGRTIRAPPPGWAGPAPRQARAGACRTRRLHSPRGWACAGGHARGTSSWT